MNMPGERFRHARFKTGDAGDKIYVETNQTVENAPNNGILKLNNKEVREKYIKAVSDIKNNIDDSLPMEEKAMQAFAARNRIRTEAI